jgi:peptidoglycan-N-acetylglucosamine deacetylase
MRNVPVIFLFIFFCCEEREHSKLTPGICLSFDDRSIHEWFQLRDLLNRHHAKVTFFITQFDSLDVDEIEKLKILHEDGHEIGSHGALHVVAEDYITNNSYQAYLENEIERNNTVLRQNGFEPDAFAYPYSASFRFTDRLLLKQFQSLRYVAPLNKERDITLIDEVFREQIGDDIFVAIGFDNANHVTKEMIEQALNRAEENHEVIFFYAHKPALIPTGAYEFDISLLEYMLREAERRKMKFYVFDDLH